MDKEILIDDYGIGHAVAIRENGKLKDLFIDPANCDLFYPPSTVLIAKILRRVRERGSYFIELPNNRNGFLVTKKTYDRGDSIRVMARIFSEHDKLQRFTDIIKVETKYFIVEEGNKGIFFSKKFSNSSSRKRLERIAREKIRNLVNPASLIVRSSANEAEKVDWDHIIDYSLTCYESLLKKLKKSENVISLGPLAKEKAINFYGVDKDFNVIQRQGIFELVGLWDELENLLKKKVFFGKRSYVIIEQTSAFCSIDVNTGSDLEITAVKVNLAACQPIVENLRLRGIGGKVIIDFIPCSKENKKEIQKKLESIFFGSTIQYKVFGWTRGNNFEIEIGRDKIPLNLILER